MKKGKMKWVVLVGLIVALLVFGAFRIYDYRVLMSTAKPLIEKVVLERTTDYGLVEYYCDISYTGKGGRIDTQRNFKYILYSKGFDGLSVSDQKFLLVILDDSVEYVEGCGLLVFNLDKIISNENTYEMKYKGMYKNDELIWERPAPPAEKKSSSNYSTIGVTDDDKGYAWAATSIAVKEKLKAPSTANFPTYSSATIEKDGAKFRITGYCDAQNSFGAMIRFDFVVIIEKVDQNNFNIISVEISE